MGDVPSNSHFDASMLTSFMTNPRSKNPIWMNNSFSTYFLLKPNASYKTVDDKFPELLKKYVGPEVQRYMNIDMSEFSKQGNKYRFFLQNIQDAHLDPSIQQEFKPASDPKLSEDIRSNCNIDCPYSIYQLYEPLNRAVSKKGKGSGNKKDRRFYQGNADSSIPY